MTKRAAYARRLKNQRLSQQDAANRCALCRLNLAEVPTVYQHLLVNGDRFCSEACAAQWLAQGGR